MRYSNGRAAKAGDIVKGKVYDLNYEIVGVLVYANPGLAAHNCQVATVSKSSQVLHNAFPETEPRADGCLFFKGMDPPSFYAVIATLAYGQLDALVAIDPRTGEILPAESGH